ANVTDNSLVQCLIDIRRALADESQQMIRTVSRRGYIFEAPVVADRLTADHNPDGLAGEPGRAPVSPVSEDAAPPRRFGLYALASLLAILVVAGAYAIFRQKGS